jgi:hypothetical protein
VEALATSTRLTTTRVNPEMPETWVPTLMLSDTNVPLIIVILTSSIDGQERNDPGDEPGSSSRRFGASVAANLAEAIAAVDGLAVGRLERYLRGLAALAAGSGEHLPWAPIVPATEPAGATAVVGTGRLPSAAA